MSEPGAGILLTGGSGRLGTELRVLLPGIVAPSHAEMDITRPEHVVAVIARVRPEVLVHAAAFTDVTAAETQRDACWRINVEGTRNVVRAAAGAGVKLVHISTDYVFDGSRGGYREDDTPGQVCNFYALSKLVAEQVALTAPGGLIVRTSFRGREWPYPKAFTDYHTSQDYVDVIAPDIALALERLADIPYNILHVATERKSAYDLARRRRPNVEPASRLDAPVPLPADVSLDVSRWRRLKERWDRP